MCKTCWMSLALFDSDGNIFNNLEGHQKAFMKVASPAAKTFRLRHWTKELESSLSEQFKKQCAGIIRMGGLGIKKKKKIFNGKGSS